VTEKEILLKEASEKISKLSFDECIKLYNNVDPGNPMIDILFDRMDELDSKIFENFLDTYKRK